MIAVFSKKELNFIGNPLIEYCLFCYFKVFGLAPITMTVKRLENRNIDFLLLKTSKTGLIYNITLIFLMIILNYFNKNFLYLNTYAEETKFENLINAVHTVFTIITFIFILSKYCLMQNFIIKISCDIIKIYNLLTGIINYQRDDSAFSVLFVAKNFLLNFLAWAITVVTTHRLTFDLTIYDSLIQLCHFVILSIVIQYCFVLKIINYLFKTVNLSILDISKKCSPAVKINLISKSCHSQEELEKIYTLQQSYTLLTKVSENISKFYSIPMLLFSSNTFLTLIICGYYLIRPIALRKCHMSYITLINTFMYEIFYVVPLINLTTLASNVVKEVIL